MCFVDQVPITRLWFCGTKAASHSQCIWQKGTVWNSKSFIELIQCIVLPLADVCWCPDICAGALVQQELNISCMSMNWTPTSQVLTGPTSDLDLFVMGLNKSSTSMEHDSFLSMAVDDSAQKAVSIILQRTEAQLIGRTLYACVGQGLQGESLSCWCAWDNDQAGGQDPSEISVKVCWIYAAYA